MLPQHFLQLDSFPLTPNGKIDRLKLPPPTAVGRAPRNEFVPPRTPAEQLLASIWQDTLRVPRVSARDNFFELGGHSLLCLAALGRLEEKTGQRLSPRVVLLNTLEQIAAQLPEPAKWRPSALHREVPAPAAGSILQHLRKGLRPSDD
jgi:hypothetical protein